ncbi:hypothetical protein BDV41DRAFT_249479 [Aspergillus transmontanensis]|uniref:Uncharacterized protein n=1 Tax=Aspergillus transmontanensis TaxID=1034304 RepID=A0A5N6VZN8_9EURO|nr:hypothetical protein BDV41DRAFT_249479 [Aspergillus transmontanensis]
MVPRTATSSMRYIRLFQLDWALGSAGAESAPPEMSGCLDLRLDKIHRCRGGAEPRRRYDALHTAELWVPNAGAELARRRWWAALVYS